jgi:long-subunit fatty acid transport protein
VRSRLRALFTVVAALVPWGLPSGALAGGFDTPILYSARHMGMGGAAIGYVDDPSALFHNPAGLRGVEGLEALGDLSLIMGRITSSPGGYYEKPEAGGNFPSRTSELVVAPAFLLGAGYRLSDWLVVGLAAFPVASASAEYRTTASYPNGDGTFRPRETINRTKLTFIEATPGVAVELPLGFSLGFGWRLTLAELERVQGYADSPEYFDFSVSGVDLKGFRVGAQWRLDEHFSVGAVYRHRIEPTLTGDEGTAVFMQFQELETTLVLPSKLGVGARGDLGDFGAAVDLEYGFYSQNKAPVLDAEGITDPIPNVFEWRNAATLRIGAEYRLMERFPLRVGYVFDGRVSNRHYPSAFGTPPAPSHSATLGLGFVTDQLSVNFATAVRYASTTISPRDTSDSDVVGGPSEDPYPCATCSRAGTDYSLWLTGLYVDVSYDFDLPSLF